MDTEDCSSSGGQRHELSVGLVLANSFLVHAREVRLNGSYVDRSGILVIVFCEMVCKLTDRDWVVVGCEIVLEDKQ